MNLLLIGATGYVGSALLRESLDRGHQVTAVARNIRSLPSRSGLTPRALDFTSADQLTAAARGHDAAILSVKHNGGQSESVIDAVKKAGIPRLLAVGGAGSLRVAPGVDLVDTPSFPELYKPEALAARDFLRVLKKEKSLDWTLLSPSAHLEPGSRTGRFRVGDDDLITDERGESRISLEDLALAQDKPMNGSSPTTK